MKKLLKFITCGSVDDGKSTLIGHMLYDAKLLFMDHQKALELDSKIGSCEGQLDYSLLLDGLMAEREQGITIDVAYRYFTTEKRSFIVADTPGHEQYTRNMAVGASFADLAVILCDATQGLLTQTKRHTRICALMGIKHFVMAVNKMDLANYSESTFNKIKKEFSDFLIQFLPYSVQIIPVSATIGDNVTESSNNMTWYKELPLLAYLEEVEVLTDNIHQSFIMPVQRVSRPNYSFRGFQGQIEAGTIQINDEIISMPSHEKAKVKKIFNTNVEVDAAEFGQAVTIVLDKEVDVSRGCVLTKNFTYDIADMFTASILWMDEHELIPGRNYLLKLGTKTIPATIMKIKYKIDVNTGNKIQTDNLAKNELAICDFSLSESIVFSEFKQNRALGSFILIDRVTNMTSACGVVEHSLRRSTNVHWQKTEITKEIRSKQKDQKPLTIWMTGLSGSGKSTLANELEKRLIALGKHTMLLDGDNIRHGLNKNLGFKELDRVENIRRIAEVSKLMNEAGLIVITSFISPYKSDRENAKNIIGEDLFIEVYVNTPLDVCKQRDVKGLYAKAELGEIPDFTGVSSPYECPEMPEVLIDTSLLSIDQAINGIMYIIKDKI